MRTLLLVKYRDEPFAKMCTRYPFAATVAKKQFERTHVTDPRWIYTSSTRKGSYETKSEHFSWLFRAAVQVDKRVKFSILTKVYPQFHIVHNED